MTLRATAHLGASDVHRPPFDIVTLAHDERRIRRKVLRAQGGEAVLVDFPAPVTLMEGDGLLLEDGRVVTIVAATEMLHEVRGRDRQHLVRLAWHLGNRHLAAQLEEERILIRRDHVIRAMLDGLGAMVVDLEGPFSPEQGAYHAHGDHRHVLLR